MNCYGTYPVGTRVRCVHDSATGTVVELDSEPPRPYETLVQWDNEGPEYSWESSDSLTTEGMN